MYKIVITLITCLWLQFTLMAQAPSTPKPPVIKTNRTSEVFTLNSLHLPVNTNTVTVVARKSRNSAKRALKQLRSNSAPCLDTSKRLLLTEDSAWISNNPITKTADNNILIPGFEYSYKNEKYTMPHLIKCSPDGKVIWSKSYYNKGVYPSSYFNGYLSKELKNGDLLLIGQMFIPSDVNGRYEIAVMRLTGIGDLIWGKTFKNSLWTDTTSGYADVADIKEDAAGNLYLAGVQHRVGPGTHSFVFKLTRDGAEIWDRNYAMDGAITCGLSVIDNELLFTGMYYQNNFNIVYFVRLNQLTGDTIATRAYKPDYTEENIGWHRSFGSPTYSTLLKNGNIAVFGNSFSDFDTYNPQDTVRHSNVAYFNPKLDFINGFSLSSKQHSNYYNTVISPDPAGNRISFTRLFYKSSYNSDIIYGTIEHNQVIKERMYQQRNRSSVWTSNFLYFGSNTDVITQYYGDSTNNTAGIEFIKLHDSDTSGYCTGTDTSLSFVEPFKMTPVSLELNVIDTNTFIETYRSFAKGVNTQMKTATGCEQVSFCDKLSIHASKDTLCANTPVLITATRNKECGTGISWDFSNAPNTFKKVNDTTAEVIFTQPWQGKVYGKISGCTELTDSVSLTVLPASGQVYLGPDTSICPGNLLIINAGKGYKNYIWNTGSADSAITVSLAGTYSVAVINACNNTFRDTIVIKQASPIAFSAGPDVSKCNGDTVLLTAPDGFISYSWSPSYNMIPANTASVKVYPPQDAEYTIKAEITPGCFAYDTVKVKVNLSPVIHVGNDTTLCSNESIQLNAGNGFADYLWSTGDVAPSITVSNTGIYSVTATAANNCTSKDTISITVKTTPVFSLGRDTLICENEKLVLEPIAAGSYIWQDGTTDKQQIATAAGLYWLKVDNDICSYSDSITVGIKPLPTIKLPADTTLCNNADLLVELTQPGAAYNWNDGDIGGIKTISAEGSYSVTVTKDGCLNTDTINISKLQTPVFNLGRDTGLCSGDIYRLNAGFANVSYKWQDNSTSTTFDVKQAGTYFVTGSNYCGSYTDTVKVNTIQCTCSLNMPNVFSPNKDGINDFFKPDLLCNPASYRFSIYNRYGSVVFDTYNPAKSWNGTFNGSPLPVGTYYYVVKVQGQNDTAVREKAGSVTLLR